VELHAHLPLASATLNSNDEIGIAVNQQDLCVVPSQSGLHIAGRLNKADGTPAQATELVNNAICFLFEELRYELNRVEIDRCRNVGLTSLMKGCVSYRPGFRMQAGLRLMRRVGKQMRTATSMFSFR